MAKTYRMKFVGDDATYGAFDIIGYPESWNFFVKTDISMDDLACPEGTVAQSGAVKSHSRQRYPNDQAPITVAAIPGGRKVYKNASKRSGGALPGITVNLATNPETWDDGDEARSFTLVGNIADLAMYLKGDAEKDIILTTNTGTKYLICAAAGNAG